MKLSTLLCAVLAAMICERVRAGVVSAVPQESGSVMNLATGQVDNTTTSSLPSPPATLNSSPAPNSTNNYMISCFRPTPGFDLFPTNRADCLEAITFIRSFDKARAPLDWTTRAGEPWQIPYAWPAFRTCRVSLITALDEAEDTFSFADIADVASAIVPPCVTLGLPPLGGSGLVGPKQIMRVNVVGAEYTPWPPSVQNGTEITL